MTKYLLLLLFCRVNFSAIYKMEKIVPKGEIVYEGDEPSRLSCIQKSFFYRAEAVYDGRRCTCVKKVVHGDDGQTVENEIEGPAYSLVGDLDQKKFKNPGNGSRNLTKYDKTPPGIGSRNLTKLDKTPPGNGSRHLTEYVSCQEIANAEKSASSGLHTIKYSSSKTIQVYCDMDKGLQVFKPGGQRTVSAGWMLIANVSFTRTISESEALNIMNSISSNVDELENAATKNFLFDPRQLLHFIAKFQKIRIYCKRERTVHIMGSQEVLDFLINKKDTCPASCDTFKRFKDNDSHLGKECKNWHDKKWRCDGSKLKRMYDFPFFTSEYAFGLSEYSFSCDDRGNLGAGTWQIFVR